MSKQSVFKFFVEVDPIEKDLLQQFKSHYMETCEFVRRLAIIHLKNNEVDDLVQDVYLKAWKSYSKFKEESSFKTWIYRISMNCIHDEFRKPKYQELDFEPKGSSDNLEEKDLAKKALFNLDEDLRELIILYFNFSYTYEEISKIKDIPLSTIKSRVKKGKELLIEYIKKNGGEHG